MFQQPSASAGSSGRPIRTMGLSVMVPTKPQLATVVASIKRQDKSIALPDLSPGSRNMPVLLEAFKEIPNGSDITLYVNQFATNPHVEPREHLIELWHTVKYKVKTIVWDQDRFFKSFVNELNEELKRDPRVARCEFQNCDKTNSCAADQPNPGFSFPKAEELMALSFFKAEEERDKVRKEYNAKDYDTTSLKELADVAERADRYEI